MLEFHVHNMHGLGRAPHSRVSLRNGPSRTIPDSLRSPQGFEMRVARPHRRFSTNENKVTSSSRQHASATGNPREALSLRRRTIAPRHSRILCAATGSAPSPSLDSRKSVPSTSRANMVAVTLAHTGGGSASAKSVEALAFVYTGPGEGRGGRRARANFHCKECGGSGICL